MADSTASDKARDHIATMVRRGDVPGIQYVIVSSAATLFEACLGVRDVASGKPVTPDTTFMASSVTKTLTAAAVLQLYESGKLDLADSLSMHFPDHPYGETLRIDQLLNQSSGVPNPLPLRWLHLAVEHDTYDEAEALGATLARHGKLRFAAGSRYAYSNLSYWLLGKVIELASGMSYAAYMRDRLFRPLGIPDKEMSCVIPDPEKHARGHLKQWSLLGLLMPLMMDKAVFDASAAGRRRLKPVLMNGPAYGGLIGTARAFGAFLQDQLRDDSRRLGADAKSLYFSEQTDRNGRTMPTTLGWHRGVLNGTPYFGKPGGGPGFQSNIRLYPQQGIASAWLANEAAASESSINAVSDAVDRHFL